MSDRSQHSARAKPCPPVVAERSNADWVEQLACGGDAGAAARELRAYLRGKLRGSLGRRGLGEHDLEDVLQDALLRILRHLHTFRGDSRFTTWAMAVAMREAFAVLRRRRREEPLGDLDPALLGGPGEVRRATPGLDLALAQSGILRVLRAAIDGILTERQRAAILGELAGVPSEELARRLGTNRNAFYKLHHDARRKLRQAILDAGFSDDEVRRELAGASEGSW